MEGVRAVGAVKFGTRPAFVPGLRDFGVASSACPSNIELQRTLSRLSCARSKFSHVARHSRSGTKRRANHRRREPARVVCADHFHLHYHVFRSVPAADAAPKRTTAIGRIIEDGRSGRDQRGDSRSDLEREGDYGDREGGRQREDRDGEIGRNDGNKRELMVDS